MIKSSAHTVVPAPASVYLCDLSPDVRDWIISQAPEVKYTTQVSSATQVIVYGDDFAEHLTRDYSRNSELGARLILCLTTDCCESYVELLRLGVHHIVFPGHPFDTQALHLALKSSSYLSPLGYPGRLLSSPTGKSAEVVANVLTADDLANVLEQTKQFFTDSGYPDYSAEGASLTVKEAVTNSLFHGFRRSGSHERKYEPSSFSRLADDDKVTVAMGHDEERIILAIYDNAGCLGPLSVGNSLDRQRTEQGLYDSRGRGFHLMRHLSQRTIIGIERGISSFVELTFVKDPSADSLRHFELIEINPVSEAVEESNA